ncbi:hypothetical protein BDD12DRAFT_809730 [Trichophaea hybrida]|nr:hypothetical protein BDD12DRAFT_809730 [Trichophaea hybrida]
MDPLQKAYWEYAQVKGSIDLIQPDSWEDDVICAWSAITQASFPFEEGFHISFELSRVAGRLDIILFRTTELGTRVEVLVIECKSPKHDQPAEWESSRDQAVAYLADTTNSALIYVGVGIGLRARFYKVTQIGTKDAPDFRVFNVGVGEDKTKPLHLVHDREDIGIVLHRLRVHAQEYRFGLVSLD